MHFVCSKRNWKQYLSNFLEGWREVQKGYFLTMQSGIIGWEIILLLPILVLFSGKRECMLWLHTKVITWTTFSRWSLLSPNFWECLLFYGILWEREYSGIIPLFPIQIHTVTQGQSFYYHLCMYFYRLWSPPIWDIFWRLMSVAQCLVVIVMEQPSPPGLLLLLWRCLQHALNHSITLWGFLITWYLWTLTLLRNLIES